MTAYGGEAVQLSSFLISAPGGVTGQLFAPAALPPGKNSGTHRMGSWLNPRASLDVLEIVQMLCSYRKSNDDSSDVQPAA